MDKLKQITSGIKRWAITIISMAVCSLGVVADTVFICAMFDNMRIFEDNKLYIAEAAGEWGLASIITLVALFIMFSAGRMYALTHRQPWQNKRRIIALIVLWALLGSLLAVARVTLAAQSSTASGINLSLIFEAAILLLLFVVAGISMFFLSQNFVSPEEQQEAFERYAAEAINQCLEQCALIQGEQVMFISQVRQANRLKRNSIDKIIVTAVINTFRLRKGLIVTEDEVPYRYMR